MLNTHSIGNLFCKLVVNLPTPVQFKFNFCSDHLKNGEKICVRVCFSYVFFFFSFSRKISYHIL